ncbi:lactonase family protein [Luteolibacter ambystomatis]|uniref:Lactonase family protein n=1 Tax=Luteolibacter ambystomatis TaxID=2824561 RepID=A0A975PGV9_9BACT|nr:lactonase family protein [Luteolibacter ambystomatis]QUE52975.1 lactonase family protein [Luteolibacter ambystomatis]
MIKPIALSLLLASSLGAAPIPVYLGTQTGGKSKSEGIYATTFDPDNGSFGPVTLAAKYSQPGFLTLHPDKPLLYCTGTPLTPFEDKTDSIAAFRIEADGKLTFLKEGSTGGRGACHLNLDGTARTMAVANYGDGRISTVRLDAGGLPESVASVITNTGTGPNKVRQDKPHAHGVYFTKANNRLYIPDLGLDKVWVHPFDAATSKLGEPTFTSTEPGAGPRHMAFTADEKHAYIIDELDNTITACRNTDGKLEPIQRIGTLPEGWSGENTTAEIEISPDGRFVYGSNRGHDSIAVFSRDADSGRLTFVQHAPCGGKLPRHFKIAPGGKWLLCAHQETATLTALPLDPATGKLGAPGEPIACPNPICILFVMGRK